MVKDECVFCGAAQASHTFLWTDALISSVFLHLPGTERAARGHHRQWRNSLIDGILSALSFLLCTFGLMRFAQAPSVDTSPRTCALWREAMRRGHTMQQAILLGHATEMCRVRTERSWCFFSSIPDIQLGIFTSDARCNDKAYFKALLREHGLPYADGAQVRTMHSARAEFARIGEAVIIKPRFGTRARHTSLDVKDDATLERAVSRALQISPWCIIERFVPGSVYRATCVGGKLIGLLEFIRPSIVADGVHTARELLAIHNKNRTFPNLTEVKADRLFSECLERQGLTESDVPEKGRNILLAEHSERPNGGYFIDRTDDVPRENRALFERAARAVRAPVVGFDIISEDISVPHSQKTLTFIEANLCPFIELHDIPYSGKPRSVAAAVWDLWERAQREGGGAQEEEYHESRNHAR